MRLPVFRHGKLSRFVDCTPVPSLMPNIRTLGPGFILAAAGIGASDVIVASVVGLRHGYTLLWAVVLSAALKFVLTEALARWQLATGETITQAWVTRFPRWVGIVFGCYLVCWTFMVGASLSSACGLAASTLFPQLSAATWGTVHALAGALLVGLNRFSRFEMGMKVLVALMAGSVLTCALLARPDPVALVSGLLLPRIPATGGGEALLSLIGGIGGSLTLICYAYWLRTAGWQGRGHLREVRADLGIAYGFTACFAIALIVISSSVDANAAKGSALPGEIAIQLAALAGAPFRIIFLLGFWCAVFASLCGVWQGVPSVYVDIVKAWRRGGGDASVDRRVYLAALAWIALPPLVVVWLGQPVAVVLIFSIVGAFFMPFLAATVLWLATRERWMGDLRNRWLGSATLVVSLVVFLLVCIREIALTLSR